MNDPFPIPHLLSVSAGHRHAAQQVIDCARRGKCCALLGPRLSGTTELLQAVQAELAQDSLFACFYIDLKEIKASTQREFFASLARATLRQLGSRVQTLPEAVSSIDSGADFRRLLKECAGRVKRDLVIIVDHLHNVPNDLIQALLTSLRAAYMDQGSGEPMVVSVVCGALSLAALTIGQTSPFANVAEAVFVNVLSDAESAALIHEHTAWACVDLSAGACGALLRATRGDPRLIERVCRACLQAVGQGGSRRVTASTVKRVVRSFIEEQAPFYEPFVEALSLIEDNPDLLRCVLLLLERDAVPRRDLPIPISPDLDALALTGMVREVEQNSYQIRNEVYRQFLAERFQRSRVGYLMALAGRWDAAIAYLQDSLDCEDSEARSELLAATVNAMYASQDVKHAVRYLTSGLASVFGVKEACIWHAEAEHRVLKLVGRLGVTGDGSAPLPSEIPLTEDRLEARAYRGMCSLRGQEMRGLVERALPLLVSASQAIGVITLWDHLSSAPPATRRERDLQLVGYLNQTARAMDEVQTRQTQLLRIAKLERERTAQELRMARDIQVSFLPDSCPSLPGWEISAQWLAAREVGGDFYDFIPLDDEHLGLVIADVSDKGMPAALFMSLCRTLVRVTAAEIYAPSKVLERVNKVLLTESRSNMFLAMFYGVLNWRSGLLTFANAGQNPPLLWRCPKGRTAGHGDRRRGADPGQREAHTGQENEPEVVSLTAKGAVLGVIEGLELEERQIDVAPGDILLLYTDGVIEPINHKEEEFGEERLLQVVAKVCDKPCTEIVASIYATVAAFAGDQPQFDDYTLVGIRRMRNAT